MDDLGAAYFAECFDMNVQSSSAGALRNQIPNLTVSSLLQGGVCFAAGVEQGVWEEQCELFIVLSPLCPQLCSGASVDLCFPFSVSGSAQEFPGE